MIQALERALAGYATRSADVAGVANRVREAASDENLPRDIVSLTVDGRLAEADLAVARVADAMADCLVHVIA